MCIDIEEYDNNNEENDITSLICNKYLNEQAVIVTNVNAGENVLELIEN